MLVGFLRQRRQVVAAAEELGQQQHARARRNRAPQLLRPRGESLGVDIERHQLQAVGRDQRTHVVNVQRRGQHFGARRQLQRAQQQVEARAHRQAGQSAARGVPQGLHPRGRGGAVARPRPRRGPRQLCERDVEPVGRVEHADAAG